MVKLLKEYENVFHMPKCLPQVDHGIELEANSRTINKPPHRLSKVDKDEVTKQVQEFS